MPRFLRRCRATIGLGPQSQVVEDLRMKFEVSQSLLGTRLPNACTLRIYNQNEETRALYEKRGTHLKLEVGHGDEITAIYDGSVNLSRSEREGKDWVTVIHCFAGQQALRNSTISRTFAAGTDPQVMIDAVAKSLKHVRFGPDLKLGKILSSQTLIGSSKKIMDQFADSYDLAWGILNGRMEVIRSDEFFGDTIQIISAATGMIGSPIITDSGIIVKALLNPNILPRRLIRIKAEATLLQVGLLETRAIVPTLREGDYVVGESFFTGDTFGNDWTVTIKTVQGVVL